MVFETWQFFKYSYSQVGGATGLPFSPRVFWCLDRDIKSQTLPVLVRRGLTGVHLPSTPFMLAPPSLEAEEEMRPCSHSSPVATWEPGVPTELACSQIWESVCNTHTSGNRPAVSPYPMGQLLVRR